MFQEMEHADGPLEVVWNILTSLIGQRPPKPTIEASHSAADSQVLSSLTTLRPELYKMRFNFSRLHETQIKYAGFVSRMQLACHSSGCDGELPVSHLRVHHFHHGVSLTRQDGTAESRRKVECKMFDTDSITKDYGYPKPQPTPAINMSLLSLVSRTLQNNFV